MTDRELLEFIATQVGTLTRDVGELNKGQNNLKDEVKDLKNTVTKIEVKLEHNIEPKLEALFDGYKQNSDKLDRIEKEVSKQEEVILRRIK